MSDEEQWFAPSAPSGNVAGARIEGDDLLVKFRSGDVYRYIGMAPMMSNLLGAPSPGQFVWRHLKSKKSVKLGG